MKLKKIALFVTTTLALFTAVPRVSADSNVQKVIDETYVKPDYVLGLPTMIVWNFIPLLKFKNWAKISH